MTSNEIYSILNKDQLKNSLEKYLFLQTNLKKVNVSKDKIFQKKYNGFYRMRQRNQKFYQIYFEFMEKKKNSNIEFEDIFSYLVENTGRYEASFSSKFIATINPNKPVWDKYVMENTSIKIPYYNCKKRKEKIIDAYNKLCDWYESYMFTNEAKEIIHQFDLIYPNTKITDIKKIDLFLWQNRK